MNVTPQAAVFAAGAEAHAKPWLVSYPPTVPHTIDETRIGTVVDILRSSVAAYPERTAVESFGVRMSYAELGRNADAVASWIQHQGLEKGDRVAIMLPNVMAYPSIIFGILSAGYAVVNVNPLYTPRELIHQLQDAGARVLFERDVIR